MKFIKPETHLIAKRLAEATSEEPFISYSELSTLIGADVQGSARGYLMSARKIARREHQMVFQVITGKGLQLLSDNEKHVPAIKAIDSNRRRAYDRLKTLAAIKDFQELSQEAKTGHAVAETILRMQAHIAKPSRMKKLEAKVNNGALPIGKTLEFYMPNQTSEK